MSAFMTVTDTDPFDQELRMALKTTVTKKQGWLIIVLVPVLVVDPLAIAFRPRITPSALSFCLHVHRDDDDDGGEGRRRNHCR